MEDYRNSHSAKGELYDGTLRASPLDAYMDRLEAHHLAQAVRALFPASIPRYLDFACGTGRITQRMEPCAVECYGVDVSESMLNAARQKCRGTRFICADLTKRHLELGTFDLITAFRFFGNAQDELRATALSAISRYMRPGGYLILNNHRNPLSFLGAWGRRAADGNERYLSHFKIRSLLRQHGFQIVRQRPIGFWIFRFSLTTARRLESAAAARLDRVFEHSFLAALAPDAVLVAQKRAN